MLLLSTLFLTVSVLFGNGGLAQLAGTHTDLPRWCGKAYEAGFVDLTSEIHSKHNSKHNKRASKLYFYSSPSFDPTGESTPPPASPSQLLYVQVEPRYSIYLGSETTGSFIVDATLSKYFGSKYQALINGVPKIQQLLFSIYVQGSIFPLVINEVQVNSADNLFDFPLHLLGSSRMEPYSITLSGVSLDGLQKFSAKTEVFYLPEKSTGSVTKIDNLNGGLLFRGAGTKNTFQSVLPYGFYGDYSGYFEVNNSNVQAYYDQGFNVVHLVTSFVDGPLAPTLDYLDGIGLNFIYDMRGSFMNLTSVAYQIPLVKDYDSFLMYYTGDEPDGWEYALNSTTLAYNLITSMDKYHPISLVLNCQDFYYGDYAAGADIILQDTYPIGINATYSIPFNTYCNFTHGDCGCDNCVGSLLDVSNRLDDLSTYQQWLGEWRKPLWSVLQAFDGEGYWQRLPTDMETWVMALLSFNHGAKGITSWIYPSTDALDAAHGAIAKVVTVAPVQNFLTGAQPVKIVVAGLEILDVAYWRAGSQVMVAVASASYVDVKEDVTVKLPIAVHGIDSTPWGNVTWELVNGNLLARGLTALATSIIILHE